MEAWLKTDDTQFRFPIIPNTQEIDSGFKVDTDFLANGNEVSMYAGVELESTSLSSHFPSDTDRTYLDFTDFPEPYECARIIKNIAKHQGEIRYIVTETDINMPIRITGFKYGTKDGSRDVYFVLDLIEHNPPIAKSWLPPELRASDGVHRNNAPYGRNRAEVTLDNPKETTRKHIVKKGESLCAIAKKYYGKESLYTKIKDDKENQKKYPGLKNSVLIHPGWELIVP